jgi:hypothetical protein
VVELLVVFGSASLSVTVLEAVLVLLLVLRVLLLLLVVKGVLDAGVPLVSSDVVVVVLELEIFTGGSVAISVVVWSGVEGGSKQVVDVEEEELSLAGRDDMGKEEEGGVWAWVSDMGSCSRG